MNKEVRPLTFYDAIYQKIIVSDPLIQSLIYTPEFQRLKNIRQLGVLSFAFTSSSTHTRFAHCLGVYHLINTLFSHKQFVSFSFPEKREVVVAGLLHDLGHGPFSHIFEKVVPNFSHENYSVQLIKNPHGQIYPLLQKYQLDVERITNLILHQTENDWGQTLVSGQFDLDRLDYLLRDRYFLGLTSSGINLRCLLDNIFVLKKKIVFQEKALLDLENYLIFRFYMHKTFFWHPENVFLENVFTAIFQRLKDLVKTKKILLFDVKPFQMILNNQLPSLDNFLELTDYNLLHFLAKIRQVITDSILQKLITVFLYPSQHCPYLLKFTNKDIVKLETQGWPRQYFCYQNDFYFEIYKTNTEEIMILTEQKEEKKLSKISMFFAKDKSYRVQLQFLFKV